MLPHIRPAWTPLQQFKRGRTLNTSVRDSWGQRSRTLQPSMSQSDLSELKHVTSNCLVLEKNWGKSACLTKLASGDFYVMCASFQCYLYFAVKPCMNYTCTSHTTLCNRAFVTRSLFRTVVGVTVTLIAQQSDTNRTIASFSYRWDALLRQKDTTAHVKSYPSYRAVWHVLKQYFKTERLDKTRTGINQGRN